MFSCRLWIAESWNVRFLTMFGSHAHRVYQDCGICNLGICDLREANKFSTLCCADFQSMLRRFQDSKIPERDLRPNLEHILRFHDSKIPDGCRCSAASHFPGSKTPQSTGCRPRGHVLQRCEQSRIHVPESQDDPRWQHRQSRITDSNDLQFIVQQTVCREQ